MKASIMLRAALALAAASAFATQAGAAGKPDGKAVYDSTCVACHGTGAAGAPKLGDSAAWEPRIKTGKAALYASATKGKGIMPPRGGNAKLSDAEVQAAVDYLVSQADGKSSKAAEPAAAPAAVAAATHPAAFSPSINNFNRLLRAPGKYNRPQAEDGIHDPENDGTVSLQPPAAAFDSLVKNGYGNHVDWVKSLNEDKINPRFDRNDPNAKPMVMDLNIVREVKGSMPDVVYPHKQHTQWLDCSNCHPAIFVPQKGANQISMAAILLGQKCGVCHGKVAFPVAECRRCHSKSKALPANAAAKP